MDPRVERLNRYKHPEDTVELETTGPAPNKRRRITAFEAVAGKAGYESHLPPSKHSQTPFRDTQTNSLQAVPPEEVLFRRQGAPSRYEETDTYVSEAPSSLPDSDLLKFLHIYASEFYSRALGEGGNVSFASLDETALIGLGVLVEEIVKAQLGETGDLAFLEAEGEDDGVGGGGGAARRRYWDGERWVRSVVERRTGDRQRNA